MTNSAKCLSAVSTTFVAVLFFLSQIAVGHAQEGAAVTDGKSAADAAGKDLRKRRLDDMRRRAQSTTVSQVSGEEKIPADLVTDPVVRHSSPFYGIVDGTLWLYGTRGRPVAAQAIELYKPWKGYYYCLESLTDAKIEVRWPGQPDWSSTKAGLEMRVLPDTPKPASNEAARTGQIKAICHRFACTRRDGGPNAESFENRFFAQPVYRYRDPDREIHDGAILVGVESGTAPDILILVEARGRDLEHSSWHYGPRRTTCASLNLRLDGKEVWSVPHEWTPGRNVYSTHTHFAVHEKYDE